MTPMVDALERFDKRDKITEKINDTCKSCGSPEFEIKSEHGITYQHCAYCDRDTIIKEEVELKEENPANEQTWGSLLAEWENSEPPEYYDKKSERQKYFKKFLNKKDYKSIFG